MSKVIKICTNVGQDDFYDDLVLAINRYEEACTALNGLRAMEGSSENPVIMGFIDRQLVEVNFGKGYVLGMLKANYDSAPAAKRSRMICDEQPLDLAIKLIVNNDVAEVRKNNRAQDMTGATEYNERYRRLSELICGFGYNMSFIEERFKQFYPAGSSDFVNGFANGYSVALSLIANQAGLDIEPTSPLSQDIWKNWPYFLDPVSTEYSLEGRYLFMYHGGCNITGDPKIPYGNNMKDVNMDLYECLRSREVDDLCIVNVEVLL